MARKMTYVDTMVLVAAYSPRETLYNFLETGRLSRDRCATNNANDQISRESYHGNVQRTENSCVEERSLEACKGPGYGVRVRDHCHGEAGTNSGKQSHDERLLSEPASVQSEKERGQ